MDSVQGKMAFDQMADYYDHYRPRYPEEIIRTILHKAQLTSGAKVLEIGAGSGKATAQFADFGFEMLCLDPGEHLIKQAKTRLNRSNITFAVSRFEDYPLPKNHFDAVLSAQAFHWIEKPEGLRLCSETLKRQGYLLPFWNIEILHDTALDKDLYEIMDRYNAFTATMKAADYQHRVERISKELTWGDFFQPPQVVQTHWEKNYTADEYFGFVMTGHVFLQNTEEEKAMCYRALQRLEARYHGIRRRYICELYIAQNNRKT